MYNLSSFQLQSCDFFFHLKLKHFFRIEGSIYDVRIDQKCAERICTLSETHTHIHSTNGLGPNRYITFGRGGELQVLLVFIDKSLDEVNLFEGQLNGVQVLGLAGNISRPELRRRSKKKVIQDTHNYKNYSQNHVSQYIY